MPQWTNWSGSVVADPAVLARPASEEEIRALVRRAGSDGHSVRLTGTGHSFTPLVASDGVIVSLDDWQGIEAHDPAAGCASARESGSRTPS